MAGSKMAVALPCAAPGRTVARPRLPTASPSESSRMDFPAPVSPVRTLRPGANSSAACSISTMSRTVRAASIYENPNLENPVESLADPGAFVFLGTKVAALQYVIGVRVPLAAGIIGAQHGGGGLGFAVQAERVIS